MINFTKMLTECVIDDDPKQAAHRIRLQTQNGVLHEHAVVIDDAFKQAIHNVVKAIGAAIDSLPTQLHSVAVSYIMRGVNTNLDALENVITEKLIEVALEEGGVVVVARSGDTPNECQCPVCTAVRRRNLN